jgi:hypothetical protein
MPLERFTLASLFDVKEGKIAAAFNIDCARAASDCHDRPNEPKPRIVTLNFEYVPICDERGMCDSVACNVFIKSALPARRSGNFNLGLTPSGHFTINTDSPDNIHQGTFLPAREEE